MTICLALLPEMLMCSCSLSISWPVPSWAASSSSFSFFASWAAATAADSDGGEANTGFTRPTWGTTGSVGRAGVTPAQKHRNQYINRGLTHQSLLDTYKSLSMQAKWTITRLHGHYRKTKKHLRHSLRKGSPKHGHLGWCCFKPTFFFFFFKRRQYQKYISRVLGFFPPSLFFHTITKWQSLINHHTNILKII